MITACFIANANAQETKTLSPVVVTATRVEQDSFDLPMSIDKVEKDTIQNGGVKMTLSESLARVPGITAQNRNQMAQDPQISSRGFGARSSFGVRGIRVYVDGIPLSMPDGIGNPGSVDLGAMSSIEVMRGPFSAMYGNSSGGVIQMFTDTAPATPEVSGDILFGSFNTRREAVQAAGTKNGVEYLVNYSDYNSDGYRQQSGNDKRQATAKLGIKIAEDTKLTMLTSWFDQFAQDPGGLKRIPSGTTEPSAFITPTGVASSAISNNTRVIRSNIQTGFNLEQKINSQNTLNFITYGGERENLQYLPVRASSISRKFSGTELKFTNTGNFFDKPYLITYGINAGFMTDARLDREAANGNIKIGGKTNRNETQKAENFDQYAQGMWSVAEKLDLHAGIRHTNLDLSILDKVNNSGFGALNFSKTIPVGGVTYKLSPTTNLYANIGKGFETPTLTEITYKDPVNVASGANFSIKPSTSTNIELGTKILISDTARINAAIFDITTKNEIVVNQQVGTTASYNNAGTTSRNGFEISLEKELQNNFKTYLAYTWLNAKFDDTFTYQILTVDSSNNVTGTANKTVKAGNYIPGTYKSQIYGEVSWKYNPWNLNTALEGRYSSKVFVDDLNADAAPSYLIFSTRASIQQQQGNWKFTEYVRIDNIFDKSYIGSIKVNDSNSRFFEPAPGRNWIMGVKANYMF